MIKINEVICNRRVELPNFQTNKQIHAIKIVPSPKEDTILISYSKTLMMNLLSVTF